MGIAEIKSAMRKTVLERRNGMDSSVRAEKSEAICGLLFEEMLLSLSFEGGMRPKVALYSPLGSEVDVSLLFEKIEKQGCDLCLPVMIAAEGEEQAICSRPNMRFVMVACDIALAKEEDFLAHPARAFSLQEMSRRGFVFVDPREIDFVVVPLVAFDQEGGRLGYGGGNYDALFQELRSTATAIGVAFEEQRVDSVPREPHDQVLKNVITK